MNTYNEFDNDIVDVFCHTCKTTDKIKTIVINDTEDIKEINCSTCNSLMFLWTRNYDILKEYITNHPNTPLYSFLGAKINSLYK